MKRKMVTIRTIAELQPIPKADRIEHARVDGWWVIVKKGEFRRGSSCVFFEIDSWLPAEDERFAFLGTPKEWKGAQGYRIRTMKMRGALSQGLALPLSAFPELMTKPPGEDVADAIGVLKWENPNEYKMKNGQQGSTRKATAFPTYIHKTDQERIQNLLQYFEQYKDATFEETLKLDGSSMTVATYKYEDSLRTKLRGLLARVCKGMPKAIQGLFGAVTCDYEAPAVSCVCSRNVNLTNSKPMTKVFDNNGVSSEFSSDAMVALAQQLELPARVPYGFAIQGEYISPKVQGNHEKVDKPEFYIFDVFDIEQQRYLLPEARYKKLVEWGLMELHIPIVGEVKVFQEAPTLEELLARVEGQSMNPDTVSEGRVYKHMEMPVSFKAINNAYLLKEK